MTATDHGQLRVATAEDGPALLSLWALVFAEDESAPPGEWRGHAQEWFGRFVDAASRARFPVIEVDGTVVATAIGTLELGVPDPYCRTGRSVRLANVITRPDHRGRGYGTTLVLDVINWARLIAADRVDLSATAQGQRLYEKLGFTMTSAPRMKLVL